MEFKEIASIAMSYIIDEALILIPVLLIIGVILKRTPNIKDWLIPYIILVIGVGFSIAFLGMNVSAIIQGVLVSGAAVFGHQLVKQQLKKKDDPNEYN